MDLLQRFNQKERSIAEIWEAVGKRCPIVVRAYDQGEDAAVVATQVCKGIPYGYPIMKGRRCYNDWYHKEDTGSVRIPEGTTVLWNLVAMPFDDMDAALFTLDLHGRLPGEVQGAAPKAAAPAPKPVTLAPKLAVPAAKPAVAPAPAAPVATPKPAPAAKPAAPVASAPAPAPAAAKPATRKAAAPKAAPKAEEEDGLERRGGSVVIPFGRYKGKTVMEVRKADAGYIDWALKNIPAFKEILDRENAA